MLLAQGRGCRGGHKLRPGIRARRALVADAGLRGATVALSVAGPANAPPFDPTQGQRLGHR